MPDVAAIAYGGRATDVGMRADDAVLADDTVPLDVSPGPDDGAFTDADRIGDGASVLDSAAPFAA